MSSPLHCIAGWHPLRATLLRRALVPPKPDDGKVLPCLAALSGSPGQAER